jgi:hypothetical protein
MKVTEELMSAAERNAKRLRTWFKNSKTGRGGRRSTLADPVLYLDVDGVLNVLGGGGDWEDFELHHVTVNVGATYSLWLSRSMGRLLRDLGIEIRWATTWADEANEKISPLVDLPTDLTVTCRPSLSWSRFKWAAIEAEVEKERRPFVWIDDEAIPSQTEVREWATGLGVRCLLIKPDPYMGIRQDDIRLIEEFIREL